MPIIIILFLLLPYEILFSMDEYFLTLRNDSVNLRQGPSFDYPVKISYKKNIYLYLFRINQIILEKLEIMKIIQVGLHISQLSKKSSYHDR